MNVEFTCIPAMLPPAVLIAEDEPKIRERLINQLRTAGIEPLVAKTGYEAIRLTKEHRPALLLLDGLLPEMHGFEIARFVRSMGEGYKPRIVLLTAIYKGLRYQNEAMLRYGADEYQLKPLSDGALGAILDRIEAGH